MSFGLLLFSLYPAESCASVIWLSYAEGDEQGRGRLGQGTSLCRCDSSR